MKNTIILLTIIVFVLAIVGGVYFFSQKNTSRTPIGPGGMVQTETTTGENSTLTSLKDIISKGISQKCTYDYMDPDSGKTSGTMFVSGGKMRGDFTVVDSEGKPTEGSVITDADVVYTWDNKTKEGVKMVMTAEVKAESDKMTQNPSSFFDIEKQTNYTCAPMIVDAGMFTPPKDVYFTDLSKMMMQTEDALPFVTGTGTEMPDKQQLCSACMSLTGDDKVACETSLKCE